MADNVFRTEITAERSQFDAQMDAVANKSLTVAQRMQSAFREASVQIGDSVKQATSSLNSHFDSITAAVGKVRGVLAAVAAVVGGGAMFGKFISDSAAATGETQKLAKMLGTTTEEASALRLALGDIGSDTDTYVGALQKMTMKLREGEERFNELGVKTRGSNGELLNAEQVMQNGLKALLAYKEGTDRNLAATELFGKGWAEVSKLMRLTPEEMEKARVKAEELQMTVGPRGAERAREYKRSVQDVHDVIEAMGNRIAQAVMPVLTDLAQWFASVGPTAVLVIRGAIGGLMSVFYGLKMVVEIVWEVIKLGVKNWIVLFMTFSEVASKAIRFDFAGAKEAAKRGFEQMGDDIGVAIENILKKAEGNRDRLTALFSPEDEQGKSKPKTGGKSYKAKSGDDAKPESQMSLWESELSQKRAIYDRGKLDQGSFETYSKQMERDFWKEKLALTTEGSKERAAVEKKYYDLERDLVKESFEAAQAKIKAEIEAHKQGSQERIELAEQSARAIGQKYGTESKEALQALAEVAKYQREAAERAKQLQDIELESFKQYQLQRVELEIVNLDTMERLGLVSGEKKLELLRQLSELAFQIELQSAQQRAQLLQNEPVAYAKALEAIEQLKRKHALQVAKIDGQVAEQQKRDLDKWIDPVSSAMEKMATGIIMGTQRWQDAVRRGLINIGSEYLSLGVKILMNWVKTEVLKTQATVAGASARTAAETASSGQSVLASAGGAIATIGAKAWEAAAAVYAEVAQIPYVGWILAPALAAAAAATVLGFAGKIASASGGFDVPSGMSPMTQLHEEEMVLPKHIANPLRDNLANGGGVLRSSSEGVAGDTHHHQWTVNITPQRGRTVVQELGANMGAFQHLLETMARNGMGKKR
jgi:hypothetical protein